VSLLQNAVCFHSKIQAATGLGAIGGNPDDRWVDRISPLCSLQYSGTKGLWRISRWNVCYRYQHREPCLLHCIQS